MKVESPVTPRVLIEVEAPYVQVVLDYIASLKAGRGESTTSYAVASGGGVAADSSTDWTAGQVSHLARSFPYVELGVLLDELAAHPNQWVLKHQVEQDYDLDANVLKSQMGGMTKRFIPEGEKWFFEFEKRNGLFWYRMTPEVAQWWTSGRK